MFENVDGRTDGRRTTDAGVTGILIAHLGAFGSGELTSYRSPGTMVHVMHVHFMFFAVFTNLKTSFSEDNMPECALDIFIENATKMV